MKVKRVSSKSSLSGKIHKYRLGADARRQEGKSLRERTCDAVGLGPDLSASQVTSPGASYRTGGSFSHARYVSSGMKYMWVVKVPGASGFAGL